ncbi:sodium:proton exchanger [Candidatus Pacearchaeota archaeon]|nr:MAG: sodium:proton exchanger [Candidatus Pacearchaeota archaeon]
MEILFIQLAIILLVAFIVSYIARMFNQPIIIGYIVAGIIISPFVLNFGLSTEIIHIFSEFGIAFLLFMVGLHLNPKVIKEIGTSSLLIGLAQIILTFAGSFLVAFYLLHYSLISSAYIGIALSFSSTIIIMKLLSDEKQLDSLYGKISIGILIVQDLVAIGVLMFISSFHNVDSLTTFAIQGLLSGAGLIIILFLIGLFVLPGITRGIAKSQELLFLFSISWCFLIAALFAWRGFSLEIGALLAGIVLAISPYSIEISSKIRPLRDFFLIIFFIILGLNIQISNIGSIITNAIILSLIALILKPIIIMIFMAMFGYTKRTNFLVGTTLAQISEFSIIIVALGFSMGQISQEVLSTITLTLILTITLSTYMIIYSNNFYSKMSRFASFFEKRSVKRERKIRKKYDAILFGYNRIGFNMLKSFRRLKKKYLVVDFNPDTIASLNKMRIPCLYGDVYDPELLDELPLDKVDLIVSTVPDFETNLLLIETVRAINPDAIIISRAHLIKDALELYKKGATYVLTPHFLGGEYIANMVRSLRLNEKKYEEEKEKHIKMLKERLEKGQEHPEVEKD